MSDGLNVERIIKHASGLDVFPTTLLSKLFYTLGDAQHMLSFESLSQSVAVSKAFEAVALTVGILVRVMDKWN